MEIGIKTYKYRFLICFRKYLQTLCLRKWVQLLIFVNLGLDSKYLNVYVLDISPIKKKSQNRLLNIWIVSWMLIISKLGYLGSQLKCSKVFSNLSGVYIYIQLQFSNIAKTKYLNINAAITFYCFKLYFKNIKWKEKPGLNFYETLKIASLKSLVL